MSAPSRFLLILFLLACLAAPVGAAAPSACDTLQARIKALNTALKKKATKEAVARMRTERDILSKQYAVRCARQPVRKPAKPAAVGVKPPAATGPQAEFPDEEIQRRREAINRAGRQFDGKSGGGSAGAGKREVPVARAIPVGGMILIEGGTSSNLYGKVKQEITYTVQETFVGNLIVTRYYDRIAGRYTGREDYTLQTLSTEIEAFNISGRGCAKYAGSRSACTQWHRFDLWQIAERDEYPGRSADVVSAASDGRGVTVRVDAPDIEFSSSEGPITIKPGCGDQFRMTVSLTEFKQWMRRSTVRIKREVGKTALGCRPGSTLTLEMHIGAEP
jgi:hypothetical protein